MLCAKTSPRGRLSFPGGGAPYHGLYGEALPGKDTFFRIQVHERVGISIVEVYEIKGNLSFRSVKGPKRANRPFYGYERDTKSSWFIDLFILKIRCIYSKGMQRSYWSGYYVKGVPFVRRKYTKWARFLSKIAYERHEGWSPGRTLPL